MLACTRNPLRAISTLHCVHEFLRCTPTGSFQDESGKQLKRGLHNLTGDTIDPSSLLHGRAGQRERQTKCKVWPLSKCKDTLFVQQSASVWLRRPKNSLKRETVRDEASEKVEDLIQSVAQPTALFLFLQAAPALPVCLLTISCSVGWVPVWRFLWLAR